MFTSLRRLSNNSTLPQQLLGVARNGSTIAALLCALAFAPTLTAQSATTGGAKKNDKGAAKPPKPKKSDSTGKILGDTTKKSKPDKPPLFESSAPLEFTLTTNQKALFKDKGDKAPWHAATISYSQDGKPVEAPLRIRTRGIWRLKHCDFPPTRLKIANKETKQTILHELEEPKLVSFCKNNNDYEQYLLQEFQLYRIYEMLSPMSHKVRLLRITYADSVPSNKTPITRYAFMVEDPKQVATRNLGTILDQKGAGPDDLDKAQTSMFFMFQYMIGNTDFSVTALHNSEIISSKDLINYPIAYDFDFAGAVNAIYATPDPKLDIKTVRDRQFRGFCEYKGEYEKAIPLFQAKKEAIYALYADEIGKLLTPKAVKQTLEYFDAFYETISKPRSVQQMLASCVHTM